MSAGIKGNASVFMVQDLRVEWSAPLHIQIHGSGHDVLYALLRLLVVRALKARIRRVVAAVVEHMIKWLDELLGVLHGLSKYEGVELKSRTLKDLFTEGIACATRLLSDCARRMGAARTRCDERSWV